MDGASGLPLSEHGGRTSLELAPKPNLDEMARQGTVGLARTVPPGMEPSSACACMSILGYDPAVYYKGRAAIEARSLGIPIGDDEVVFRCNLLAVRDGAMWDYSAGHITTAEAQELIGALNEALGGERVRFYPGMSYRHICKLTGARETLQASCTPPHDIPRKAIAPYLPGGEGSGLLRDLMERSKTVLAGHPVNRARQARGEIPATQIWLFWGSGPAPEMPSFRQVFGVSAAMTSAVDLLRGLARMVGMDFLEIPAVTDGMDNDFAGQARGALAALESHDLVVVHVEAPDEAAHGGSAEEKIEAIERIDKDILSRLRAWRGDSLRVLVMPDHPTPIVLRTHSGDPVPFVLWGDGFKPNGAEKFSENEAKNTSFFIEDGYNIMQRLIRGAGTGIT